MSDLQRAFAKAKLAGLPFNPPMPPGTLIEDEDDEQLEDDELRPLPEPSPDDDSSSASSASSASSTGTIRPSPSKHLFVRPKGYPTNDRKALDPLPWTDYFSQELYLPHITPTARTVFHVYITPPANKGPLFVTHHGAGSSGLSFAVCASEIKRAVPDAGILSVDARGHGETVYQRLKPGTLETLGEEAGGVLDLSLETLSEDLFTMVQLTKAKMGWAELPGMILVGHSLGGAVVVDAAKQGKLGNAVLGYAVLDVVEGSAIDALQSMQTYLSSRPTTFPSISAGIEWHTRTRTLRNPLSARVSVPSLLCPVPPSASPTPTPLSTYTPISPSLKGTLTPLPSSSSLTPSSNASLPPTSYTWRTNLAATHPFWHSWFLSLSSKFLSARGGKLLLLAGTDRLDKELMIGQMQGKYQLVVFPDAGHFIQEDLPGKTAGVLVDFWRRNDGRGLQLPRKVGEGVGEGKREGIFGGRVV